MKSIKKKRIKNYIKIMGLVILLGLLSQIHVTRTEAATFKLSSSTVTLRKGESKTLKAKNLPAKGATVQWKTSNNYAVTVTSEGQITAVNYGSATITAVCKNKVATCTVTIPDDSRTIVLNQTAITLQEQETFQLMANSVEEVTFQSGNEAIATVDETGFIKAVNPGVVTITAKAKSGYTNCTVTVLSNDAEVATTAISPKKRAIRMLNKKGKVVYDYITKAKNKDVNFTIANLDASKVKKCVWSSSNTEILSKPTVSKSSKITASAKTLKVGKAKIIAVVTYKSGKVKTYKTNVYVTNPSISTKEVTLWGATAGANRQQFVSLSGLNKYSKVTWSDSNGGKVSFKTYKTKAALSGLKAGSGTIKASVDGKVFKIKYTVKTPNFNKITPVLCIGNKTTINISGIDGITPEYTIRNKNIASVSAAGVVKGKSSGVTYVDVKLGNMVFSYRVEVQAKGMKTIIKRATYIVNNWTYSQGRRMQNGYYDCSALVWKGYKAYNEYQTKLGNATSALPAGELFDYLYSKNQIVYFGYTGIDDMKPGDLIFYGDYESAVKYSTPGRTLNIYHVSMYAGDGKVVEKGGQTINYNNIKHIVGIGRVVE